MLNPAEEIVNIWLQDHFKYFITSNLVVPQKNRLNTKGGMIGGGRGKEIDFLATNGKGKYYWVEVSVSPNPRLPGGADKSRDLLVDTVIKKFAKEKEKWLQGRFKIKKIEKWFVYSPKLFSFFRNGLAEERLYCNRLQKKNIKAISFAEVLKNVYSETTFFGYDSPRQYIFLLKKMGYKYEELIKK